MGGAGAVHLVVRFAWKERRPEVMTPRDPLDVVNDLVRWSGDGKVGDKEAWEESCGSSQGTGMKRDI